MLTLGRRGARLATPVPLRQFSASYILGKPPSQMDTLLQNPPRVRVVDSKLASQGSLGRHSRLYTNTQEMMDPEIFHPENLTVFKDQEVRRESVQLVTSETSHQPEKIAGPPEVPAQPSQKLYFCRKCGKKYKSASGRNKHERKCKETLPLSTDTEITPTESMEIPKSIEINVLENKNVEEMKESTGEKQEVLEAYFDLMVNTDLLVNQESKLDEALEEFRALKSNPELKVNLNTLANFNTFLRGFARESDFHQIQELWREMTELQLKPDLNSYISVLLSFHAADSNNPVYQKVYTALYEDFKTSGYSLDKALHHGDFLLEDRERFLRTISLYRGQDLSSYVPSQNGSNSPLVEDLNNKDSSELTSQIEQIMEGEDLRKLLETQLTMERQLLVPIPSICKDENSPILRRFTDKLLKEWEENIEKELRSKIYCRNSLPAWDVTSSARYSNFLTFLPPDKLTEIILSKAVSMLTSDGFSEPIHFIRADLGDSVMNAYHLSVKTDRQSFDKFQEGMAKYYDWYCSPKGKDPTHRDALAKAMWNVSTGTKMKKWPKSLRLTLGDEILKILFRSCKLDKYVKDSWDHVVIDGKYLTCNNNQWSETQISEKTSKHPAFFKIFRKRKGNFDVEEVKPNPALFKLFSASSMMELRFPPEDLPMLVPPLPWVSPSSGGYIIKNTQLIKYPDIGIYEHEDLLDSLPPGSLNPVLDSLNQLGSVAWIVNKPILDLAIQLFNDPQPDESLLYELDIPLHKDMIKGEPKLSDDIKASQKAGLRLSETQKLEYRNYHNARQMHAKLKEEKHSLWCSALYRLSLAKHFQDEVLWFPHNVDFRGRCYPIPSQLNHMGADLPRSLLVFAKGKKLGPNGFYWLKLHCINLTGTMKRESIDRRIAYVDSIIDKIVDSARDPLNGERWWLESDDPWQTLSACIEIKNALEHPQGPEDYTCHLPIHQDGSCNGLQHYAALGRDKLGAEAVNLVPSDKPGDVYSLIASIVDSKREIDSKEGNEIARILEGHIKRKVVKQTVMTTVYGVTRYGAKLQIKKQLRDIREFPLDCVDEASQYVAGKTFHSLNEVFESSQRIQAWLTDCAGVISKECKRQVSWFTPLGFPVIQPYYKKTKSDKKIDLDRKFLLKEDKKDDQPSFSVNTSKNRNGFPPNFIHSLDSSHMMLTSLYLWSQGVTFASVHDCFWTHACDVEAMNSVCRQQFIALHEFPILESLSEHFIASHIVNKEEYISQLYKPKTEENIRTPKQKEREEEKLERLSESYVTNMARRRALFKEIPQKGQLDLQVVKDSIYFFS